MKTNFLLLGCYFVLLAPAVGHAAQPPGFTTGRKALPSEAPNPRALPAATAEEVLIPNPTLEEAIRLTLDVRERPLTTSDLSNLTSLRVQAQPLSLEGLEWAANLLVLDLSGSGELSGLDVLSHLSKLVTLDVSGTALSDLSFLSVLPNLSMLNIAFSTVNHSGLEDGGKPPPRPGLTINVGSSITNLTLPGNLTGLTTLTSFGGDGGLDSQPRHITMSPGLTSLRMLDLSHSSLANLTLPDDLTHLTALALKGDQLTSLRPPAGLTNLESLDLGGNPLEDYAFLGRLTQLTNLNLSASSLTDASLPPQLPQLINLRTLDLSGNQLTRFVLPGGLTNLQGLVLGWNRLAALNLPEHLAALTDLDVSNNRLTNLVLPSNLTSLVTLSIQDNQLSQLTFPASLNRLTTLDLSDNQLQSLDLPAGMTNLSALLWLDSNQVKSLTLPSGLDRLVSLSFTDNALATLILPEALAAGPMAQYLAGFRSRGLALYAYPEEATLTARAGVPEAPLILELNGPPGTYTLLRSPDLHSWSSLSMLTNEVGVATYSDAEPRDRRAQFYRVFRP